MSPTATTMRPRQDAAPLKYPVSGRPNTEAPGGNSSAEPTRQPAESRLNRIARRAHEIYEERGGEHGKSMEDWLKAERQIDAEIDRASGIVDEQRKDGLP